jgi:hypothetical protein
MHITYLIGLITTAAALWVQSYAFEEVFKYLYVYTLVYM